MRQAAPLFGVSLTAAHRIIDRLSPLLGTTSTRRPGPEAVLIVDGTLVPVRERTVAAVSKNYRHSVNLQVLIEADTRVVLAIVWVLADPRNRVRAVALTPSAPVCMKQWGGGPW